jgi:hypothetical protein
MSKVRERVIVPSSASRLEVHSWEDNPAQPSVVVSVIEDSDLRYRVHLAKSLEREPTNVGHPVLITAVIRYTKSLEQRRKKTIQPNTARQLPTSQVGKKCLECLFTALQTGARKRRTARKHLDNVDVDAYLNEVFTWLAPRLTRDKASKNRITKS